MIIFNDFNDILKWKVILIHQSFYYQTKLS
jgi:hypothetical protein